MLKKDKMLKTKNYRQISVENSKDTLTYFPYTLNFPRYSYVNKTQRGTFELWYKTQNMQPQRVGTKPGIRVPDWLMTGHVTPNSEL